MTDNLDLIRSAFKDMVWPAVPPPPGAMLLALQFQLGQTQWWSPDKLQLEQFRQLGPLLHHARETVPFYRERLDPGAAVTQNGFAAIPLLTRADVHAGGEALHSRNVPAAHAPARTGQTSGSTGMPITYLTTAVTRFFWQSFNLRDQLWHRRDLSGTLATIRPSIEDAEQPGWGPSIDSAYASGHTRILNIRHDLDAQLDWLQRRVPAYLISNAYNLYWLARRSIERGIALPGLREARSYGGTFPADARDVVRRAWNVPLTDVYTAEEVGYIALQCPDHESYHVQAENLIVEVLGEDGKPCGPGEIGRVVLTTLHNYAMPLIRYEIGDYAEIGEPCRCGRGLPVIARILGRQRNILTLPDGRQRWPSFPSSKWSHAAPVRQVQLIQKSPERIVVRVVAERALTRNEEQDFLAAIESCLGHPFRMELERVSEIPRSASHKFEDFVSEIVT